jgi:hypothetical protein
MTRIETGHLKLNILNDLKDDKWFTDRIEKRKAVKNYVTHVQNQILLCKKEQRLDLIADNVFDVRNRIFSIDKVFSQYKNCNCNVVNCSCLALKSHKFVLLEQTKLIHISKLPRCKIVIVKISKAKGGKRSLGINTPIDKVLQRMFLNYLDKLIEDELNFEVFAYRKKHNARMAIISVFANLNQVKYIQQLCICSIIIEKYVKNFFHDQIKKLYPFPKRYSFLLCRWLTSTIFNKNHDSKNVSKFNRGIPPGLILGPSISNLLLSNVFSKNVLKQIKKKRQKLLADIFFYANEIIFISNNQAIFYRHLIKLRKNLQTVGLVLNERKIKSFAHTQLIIKFQFLGFEFVVMPKNQ